MVQAPCMNCNDRELGCHDKCNKYITFKGLKSEERNMIKEQKQQHNQHVGYLKDQKEKRRKAKG